MSLSTLRKNFYRIALLIIDHGAESMRCLLDRFIQNKNINSFKDYVSNHQHDIYHHFNNTTCCLCSRNSRRPYKTVIGAWQMEKLFDKNSKKPSYHKHSSKCEYCCSTVKSTLQLQDIDITLLRFFLVTYFEEEFWKNCISGSLSFQDFLNTHKHDIFHLLQLNTPCCLCMDHPGYTTMLLTQKDRLNIKQWEAMFHTSKLPCTYHQTNIPNGDTLTPCSVSATIGIQHSDLKDSLGSIVLSKFGTLMKHIDVLVNARNTAYAHAIKAELSDEEFTQLWKEIENSIIYISGITGTDETLKRGIWEMQEISIEELTCLELQCQLLKTMQGNTHVLQACCKLQDTVEMIEGSIDVKLQQVELQLTSIISDVVRNDISTHMNKYSDTTRNIIDNTRTEIEFHDQDTTYVKTSAVASAMELLSSKHLLIIFGRAGSGKTSTVLEIASIFHADGYIVMKLEQNLARDFKTYFLSRNKQLIIFEDLFGKADIRYNADIHSNLLKVLEPHVTNGVSKFIITVRSYKSEIDDDIVTRHQLLSKAEVLNLNENPSLTYSEKESILTMHAKHNGIDILYLNIQSIIKTNSFLGFPEACRLFCSFDNFFEMGHTFFTAPTKELLHEINFLKQSGYRNLDSGLQYCVLVFFMIDSACKESVRKNLFRVSYENNYPSNHYKNINSSFIESLYQSLFKQEILLTNDEVYEICKTLSNKYIKKDLNSNSYVFQHLTVFEAVLSSYWHKKTINDIIKYFKVDILAEHVRPFDSISHCNTKSLVVRPDKCPYLAQQLFETIITNYADIIKCNSIIHQSQFILKSINQKLDDWFSKEENVLNCEWVMIKKITRHFNHRPMPSGICARVHNKYLIQRLLNELNERAWDVKCYLCNCEMFSNDFNNQLTENLCNCEIFATDFKTKLTERFQSEENLVNCHLLVIYHFICPTTFRDKHCKFGTVIKDSWLIQVLINRLVEPGLFERKYYIPGGIKNYILKHGDETFVNVFNEKLTKRFQTDSIALNCEWSVIYHFIRPTTFNIENGQVGSVANDEWLIQRLGNELVEYRPFKNVFEGLVKDYLNQYGCDTFVKKFNIKLTDIFEIEKIVFNCSWETIFDFVRPSAFKMPNGQVGTNVHDNLLIQRLINILVEQRPSEPPFHSSLKVKDYIKKYGCLKFLNDFNEKLTKRFQSENVVSICKWKVIYQFGRPTAFKIKDGQIGALIEDSWLIQKLMKVLMEHPQSNHANASVSEVKAFVKAYGCKTFVKKFNEELTKRFQSEENVVMCEFSVIQYFVRPITFRIKHGQIGTVLEDSWLIQRLINELVETTSLEPTASITLKVNNYIEKYGCNQFVKDFNEKLTERFNSETIVLNCQWEVIFEFVRPATFKIETGQTVAITKDIWLIKRLIIRLLERFVLEDQTDKIWEVQTFIKKYGCKTFVRDFNKNLTERFQSETIVMNCKWEVIYLFVRPTTFKIQIGQIGASSKDKWVIQRLINSLIGDLKYDEPVNKVLKIKDYIEMYGCKIFVNDFNEKLRERFQSEEIVMNCKWEVIQHFVRPTSFQNELCNLGTVIKNNWLIQKLMQSLVKQRQFKSKDDSTLEVIDYITKYGCEKFIRDFNEKLTETFDSEKTLMHCKWEIIHHCIRPTSFKIEQGQICILINDDWLTQRLLTKFVEPELFKHATARILEGKVYIETYGCETFVREFIEKLKEWILKNMQICNWPLFKSFVRPQSSLAVHTTEIRIDDHCVILFLLTKLEQQKYVYHIRSYIRKYGSSEFVKLFNKHLRDKINHYYANDQILRWKYLELCFDNVLEYDTDTFSSGDEDDDSSIDSSSQGSDIEIFEF